MQENIHFTFETSSWTNVTREKAATKKKQWIKNELSLLCKKYEVLIKIIKKKNVKKSINQIFQKIKSVLMMQQNLIMLLYKLESENVALHAINSEIWMILKRFQEWMKKIID